MPKMPDETALGTVQPISPGVVQGPRDYIGAALQSVGGDLMQIGARAKAEAEKKKNEDDALDLGRARADWNSRRLLEDDNYRLDKDSDYSKWEPKFQKNIKVHQEASANLIRDPKVREKFQIETEDDITRGTLSVRDRSGAIDRGKKEAEFLQGIDTNMRLAGAPGTDDKTRDEITARTRADIDNAVASGLLDPGKAIELRQKFVKGISVFRAQQLGEDDPEALLGHLNRPGQGKRLAAVYGTQAGRQPVDKSHMNPGLMSKWEETQGAFGRQIPIVSANRDSERNAKAGGAKGSQHLHGNAIDLDVSDMPIEERKRLIATASAKGFTGIGVYGNSIHLDMGGRRAWGPSHHGDSVPEWASGVIGEHLGRKGGGSVQTATSVVKGFEGYRSTPYPDVGGPDGKTFAGYRVGYGSDTITREDGTVVRVKPGMTITKADAERDLERRMGIEEAKIVKNVGEEVWNSLDPNVRAAINSVAYNYTGLPESVTAAVKTGDTEKIAQAVEALKGHNAGINAGRRMKEAAIIRSGGSDMAQAETPDYMQYLDPEDRLRLQASAEAEVTRRERVKKEENALERYQMGNLLDDDIAQLEMTGKGQDIDPAMVAATMGDAKAAEWLDKRSEAAASYRVVETIDSLSNDEIAKHLDELQPEEGSPDYAKQARLYDKALTRSAKVLAEREKDPAKAVAKAPMVKAALENFDPKNPQSHQALVKARLAAQDAIGIPGVLQNPVTREDAAQLFAPIVKALDREDAEMAIAKGSSTPAERRASVKEIKAATQAEMKKAIDNIEALYGPYAGQVLTQAIAQNFRNQNDANLMANVLRKINAGERVTQSDISALDQTSEATQAEDALAPTGGGSWLPDWVTKPLKIYGQVYQPPGVGLALKMRDDATKFAQEKANAKKVGPFAPVTQRAIQALIANPSQAEAFDKMFGPGEAEKWLPKKQKPVEASQ